MYKTLVEAVLEHGKDKILSEKLAIGWREERISYAELCALVKAAAAKLSEEYNINRGDIVMLTAVRSVEYIVILLAIQYLGATSIALDKSTKEQKLSSLYEFIHPKLVLTDIKVERIPVVSQKSFYKDMLSEKETLSVAEYQCPDAEDTAENFNTPRRCFLNPSFNDVEGRGTPAFFNLLKS